MSKRTRPRNLQALERRRWRHARRSETGIFRAVFARVFAASLNRQYDLGYAIRRRLATQSAALAFSSDYGLSLTAADFPTPWIEMLEDPAYRKLEYRLTSPTQIEYRVTPHPIVPYINVSIGFAGPEEVLLRARAVGDAATCETCTSENGCRCVAEPPA